MFTNVTTLAARPCESRRSGTAASRLWAAAGVSSDLAGGVKAPCPISKLPENEADTVRRLGSGASGFYYQFSYAFGILSRPLGWEP